MAAYPAYKFYPGSVRVPSQKAESFVDGAGGHHVYWQAAKGRFTLKHVLTTAEADALKALWLANKLIPVTFVWYDDTVPVNYNVVFLEEPKAEGLAGLENEKRNVTVELGVA